MAGPPDEQPQRGRLELFRSGFYDPPQATDEPAGRSASLAPPGAPSLEQQLQFQEQQRQIYDRQLSLIEQQRQFELSQVTGLRQALAASSLAAPHFHAPQIVVTEPAIPRVRQRKWDARMGIPVFNQWVSETGLEYEVPLATLQPEGITGVIQIGIEAGYYLQQFRHPSREPLVSALNGFPLALEGIIAKQIKQLEDFGLAIWFYFDGVECEFDDVPFQTSIDAAQVVSQGFDIYESGEPAKAIEKFRQADYPDMITLQKFLKYVLNKNGIGNVTAPFRALSQMIAHQDEGIIHYLFASTEAFLYGAPNVMTKVNIVFEPHEYMDNNGVHKRDMEFNLARSTYHWINREAVLKALNNPQLDHFHDALLFAGSSYLETFPPLLNAAHFPQPINFRVIVDILTTSRGDPRRALEMFPNDERVQASNYPDKFQKAFIVVHNMPIQKSCWEVVTRSHAKTGNTSETPRDLHEILGLKWPAELLFYQYAGLIGNRVLNWFAKAEIRLYAPPAGGDAAQYRNLVKKTLKQYREQAMALLAYSIHRAFLYRQVKTTCWFDNSVDTVTCNSVTNEKPQIQTWRMKHKELFERAAAMEKAEDTQGPGTLAFALRSLKDTKFAASTIYSKSTKKPPEPIESVQETSANVLWRTLYLVGYVDTKHQLTAWGKVMLAAMDSLGQATMEQAECVFVAVELLRLGVLKPGDITSGSDPSSIKANSQVYKNLVCRVACVGRIRHPPKGYSGPLSRELLAFHAMVFEIRRSLRDMVESNAAVIYLDGEVKRDMNEFKAIADTLPFQEEWSAGLGFLTLTYLDDISAAENPEDEAAQRQSMLNSETYLVHSDVKDSYQAAVKIWSGLATGVKASGSLVDDKTKEVFAQANSWLVARSKPFL